MNDTFWNPPSPSTPTNCHLQSVVKERNLKLDVVAFCSTFTDLLFLASPDAIDMLKEDVATVLTEIWDRHIGTQDPSHWGKVTSYTEITHFFVQFGVQAPFVTFYSLYSQGSLDRDVTFCFGGTHSFAMKHSLLCM